MKFKEYILVFLVVLLAFILRFYKVAQVPPALNWDEVSIAYNAYSILKTGHDEWGKFLPVHFRSYGEYKLPVQIYISIPGIWLFGLNELGVRITPVIYGILTVLVVFFLAREIFGNFISGFSAAFFLAVSPWHIQLTRVSFESSLATLWVTLGILLLVKGFKNSKWFIVSMIPFALSIFTYNSARVFTPIFLLTILIFYRNYIYKFKKAIIGSVFLFFILMIPLTPFIVSGNNSARYKLVSITDDPGLVPRINENRTNSKLPYPLPRLIHNRVTYITYYLSRNYLAHFTPQFLFTNGAPHKQHHVQNIGQLYIFQAPFLIFGLIMLILTRNKFKNLLLSWVFMAFIPVSVTNDSIPHALRTLIAAPFYQLISGFGVYCVYEYFKNKRFVYKFLLFGSAIILITINISGYLYNYYQVYPNLYSRDWQYGYKQVVEFIKDHKDEYDQIVFTRHYGEPHMFTLFYLNYDPLTYQTDPGLVRFETYDWVRVLRFNKFYFPDLGDKGTSFEDILIQSEDKRILFIGKKGDFPENWHKLLSVNFLNGDTAFEIVERK